MKPILFSTEMVEAINNNHKTQTRRIIKFPADYDGGKIYHNGLTGVKYPSVEYDGRIVRLVPKYEIGEKLWVRETWQKIKWQHMDDEFYEYIYKASEKGKEWEDSNEVRKWKPSIYMPREACRLFLEVINIRAEQVQDISAEDAQREGIKHLGGDMWKDYLNRKTFPEFMRGMKFTRTASFKSLWQKINGLDSWEKNPWVWVIDFKKIIPQAEY